MEAKAVWNTIQVGIAAVGGWLGYILGGFDGFLYALVTFIVADYLTGVACALIDKSLSSEVGAKGIVKKVLIFVMVGISHTLDRLIIGNGEILRDAVIFFYLANEGISLLENTAKLGLPIPDRLRSVLSQIKSKSENQNQNGGNDDDNQ